MKVQKLSKPETRVLKYLAKNGPADCEGLYFISKSTGEMKKLFKKLERKGLIQTSNLKLRDDWNDEKFTNKRGNEIQFCLYGMGGSYPHAAITERGAKRIVTDGPETEFAKTVREEADQLFKSKSGYKIYRKDGKVTGWYRNFWEKYTDSKRFQEEGTVFYEAMRNRKITEFS